MKKSTVYTAAAAMLAKLEPCRLCSSPGLWDLGPFENGRKEGRGGLFCDEHKAGHRAQTGATWVELTYAGEVRDLAAAINLYDE